MDNRTYRLGLLIAAGLFLNALVGMLSLFKGTPAHANPTAKAQAVYLVHPENKQPLAVYTPRYELGARSSLVVRTEAGTGR